MIRLLQIGDAVRLRGQQRVMTVYDTNDKDRMADLSQPRAVMAVWHADSGQPLNSGFREECLELVEAVEPQ